MLLSFQISTLKIIQNQNKALKTVIWRTNSWVEYQKLTIWFSGKGWWVIWLNRILKKIGDTLLVEVTCNNTQQTEILLDVQLHPNNLFCIYKLLSNFRTVCWKKRSFHLVVPLRLLVLRCNIHMVYTYLYMYTCIYIYIYIYNTS